MRGITKVFTSRYAAIAWATGIVVLAVQVIGVDDSHAAANAADPTAVNATQNKDQPVDQLGDPITNEDESNLKNAIDSIG